MNTLKANVRSVALLLRFEYLPFSLLLALMGFSTTADSISFTKLVWLLFMAFLFHIFICFQNDYVDLALDRTDPRRAEHPLVKRTVSPWTVFLAAVFIVPVVFSTISIWEASRDLYLSAGLIFGCMSLYNIWGKKTRFPLLTDFAQAVGFAGLVLFGATSNGPVNRYTISIFLGIISWMMLTNLMGGIRDLRSDQAFGLFTAPLSLGSHYEQGYFISRRTKTFAYTVIFLLFFIPSLSLVLLVAEKEELIFLFVANLIILGLIMKHIGVFFEIAELDLQIEFDLALLVMYLSALPMLLILLPQKNSLIYGPIVFITIVIVQKFLATRNAVRNHAGAN